jgi:hypothetical protein
VVSSKQQNHRFRTEAPTGEGFAKTRREATRARRKKDIGSPPRQRRAGTEGTFANRLTDR